MIADWAREKGFPLAGSHLYRGDPLPAVEAFDFLVIMGGAMNIYQHRDYPWLVKEKLFIQAAISQGKIVLGICLGAQLIADVLGAKVFQNPEIEIGWFPVELHHAARKHPAFKHFPRELTALHWHGDTFNLPAGSECLASTVVCQNQAFLHGERVAALQFHIEVAREDIDLFLGDGDYGSGRFIQPPEALRACESHVPATRKALWALLDGLAQQQPL